MKRLSHPDRILNRVMPLTLNSMETDTIGEILNISMGAARHSNLNAFRQKGKHHNPYRFPWSTLLSCS